jgi:hypothetical protein
VSAAFSWATVAFGDEEADRVRAELKRPSRGGARELGAGAEKRGALIQQVGRLQAHAVAAGGPLRPVDPGSSAIS